MISGPGENPVERVAADANVLLSAVIGKAALRVFTAPGLEILSTRPTLAEVAEYLPHMASSYGIQAQLLEGQFRLLRLKEIPVEGYRRFLPEAGRRLARRDPDDVELLALALALRIPVWSNDSDFRGAGVRLFTTAQLLKVLGV